MEERVRHLLGISIEGRVAIADLLPPLIVKASERLTQCFLNNGKLLLCGYGGSAANVLHFSSAMLSRFEVDRPALPVIALTTDLAVLNALDGHADQVFARQIQALGQAGDVLVMMSTSGQMMSLINAVHAAHERDMDVVVLNGRDGGVLSNHLGPEDIELCVPGETAALIRETHLFILHCFCDLIDQSLFGQMLE